MAIYDTKGKRGRRWHYAFRHGGQRYKGSAGTKGTEGDAKNLEAKRRREVIDELITGPRPERVTFSAFANDYFKLACEQKRSAGRDEAIIEMLKIHWKGKMLDEIRPDMIEAYKVKRLRKRKPATVSKEIQVCKRLFRKAAAWGKLAASPAADVARPSGNQTRVRFLDPEEWGDLWAALPEWLRPFVMFSRATGCRRGELLSLTWADIDQARGIITFRDTKNGETGHVEMNETARAVLESLPKPINRAQRVFPSVKVMKLRRAWERACKKAGVIDYHWHDLRHQAASDLLNAGAGLNDVRDFLRHKTMNMTLRYAHLDRSRRTRTAGLLDAVLSSAVATGPEMAPRKSTVTVSPSSPSSSLA